MKKTLSFLTAVIFITVLSTSYSYAQAGQYSGTFNKTYRYLYGSFHLTFDWTLTLNSQGEVTDSYAYFVSLSSAESVVYTYYIDPLEGLYVEGRIERGDYDNPNDDVPISIHVRPEDYPKYSDGNGVIPISE